MGSGVGQGVEPDYGDGESSEEPLTLEEAFCKVCPYYLAIGMTWEQFWRGDPFMAVHFREAAMIKNRLANQMAWIQGSYIYDALCAAAPLFNANSKKGTRAQKYHNKPYSIFGDGDETAWRGGGNSEKHTEAKRMDEKGKPKGLTYMETYMAKWNQGFHAREAAKKVLDAKALATVGNNGAVKAVQ